MSSILKHKTFLLLVAGIALATILVFAALFFMTSGATYVRIVDTSDIEKSGKSPDPGADLNAVEIVTQKKGETFYASSVVSSNILEGAKGNENKSMDASSILGDPQQDQDSRFVSLGGGEIVVKLDVKTKSGDQLTVYEIGTNISKKGEAYEIYTSKNSNGPWNLVGSGTGPTTITIE